MKRILSLALITVLACRAGDRRAADSARPAATPVTVSRDAECRSDTLAQHRSARQLLEDGLARNSRGEQVHGHAPNWWMGASECPDHAPGWDMSTLVTGWRIETLRETPDTAIYVVRFDEFGVLSPGASGMELKAAPREHPDTVVLVRTIHTWRFANYGLDPFLLPDAARSDVAAGSPSAHVIDSLITVLRTPRGH